MGVESITPVANSNTSRRVNFSQPYRAGVVPTVVVAARSSVMKVTVYNVSVTDIDSAGFTLWIYRTNATATNVHYLAVGER